MHRIRRLVIGGTLICLGAAGPVWADESLLRLLACRDLSDANARLACFDREAAALSSTSAAPLPPSSAASRPAAPTSITPAAAVATPAAPVAAPAAVVAAPAQPAAVLDPQQKFGLAEKAIAAKEVAAGTRAPEASKIEAHITQLVPGADGRIVFSLDNEQVWRQLSAEGEMLAKQGDTVTISRGALGSYWLQIKSGRGCKVTRLL
jgi:hypothetical protein